MSEKRIRCNDAPRWPTNVDVIIAEHWTVHTRGGWNDAVEPASASWLWAHLRAHFPAAYANTLMPDHLHLVPPGRSDPDLLRRILQGHARRFGARWSITRCEPVHTARILERTCRYAARNADRAGLVDDPLEWPWSTLRDMLGATVDPWTPIERIAKAVRRRPDQVVSYCLDGAPDPTRQPLGLIVAPLAAIAEAAAAATRATPDEIRRPGPTRALFLALARDVGGARACDLAEACGITERTIRRLDGTVSSEALAAARRCLGDPRLRRWTVPGPRLRRRAG